MSGDGVHGQQDRGRASPRVRRAASLGALAAVVALYVATGALSSGFDDETYTIGWITSAESLSGLLRILAGSDLHPPGSYLAVRWLHELTGSFAATRAIAGALNAVMLWWLWRETAPRAPLAAFFAWLALCLSPTMLLWGATLRWYSWFLPVVIAFLILIRRNPADRWRFWGGFAIAAVVLVHIGYFALVMLPALIAAALWRRRDRLRSEGWLIAGLAALSLAAIAPQLILVMPGQLRHGILQHEQPLLFKALGAGLDAFATHAAMPLSLPAAAFVLGNLILLGAAIRRGRAAFATPAAIVFLGGLAGAFAAGLTGHFRSLVVLSPAKGIWQGQLFAGLGDRAWRLAALGLFLAGTLVGLTNVVTHRDTTKSGWNSPYRAVLESVSDFRQRCPDAPVATHDPVLFWLLERRGTPTLWGNTMAPPSRPAGAEPSFDRVLEIIAEAPCLVAVQTYRGIMAPEAYDRFVSAIDRRGGPREVRRLGPDRHAGFKRLFDPVVPDYTAVVTFFPPPG